MGRVVCRPWGHRVRRIAPQYVKPFVRLCKKDPADAAAISDAASRPDMRCVPVKTAEQQTAVMVISTPELLVRQRTQLVNAVRGPATEFGLVVAKVQFAVLFGRRFTRAMA